ncbi:L-serine dehydratase, iron-sulfur-dependent subunit alpha [Clostridium sp. W14A]|nr:L-serine dehydratase, iron-sulfur-dependent subunit alpha [Clostridium sp. W14A]
MFAYESVQELISAADKQGKKISELVLRDQAEYLEKESNAIYEQMHKNFLVMKNASEDGLKKNTRSASGLTDGNAIKMNQVVEAGKSICGRVIGKAIARALAVSETNACMGRIVAAPTAGSCGILPAAVLTLAEEHHLDEHDAVMSLFTAAGFGMVIAKKASIAGAEGGCQAECGSAAAMAAAALTELMGGTPQMAGHACSIAIKNILGLVCDPVAGLVEIPCIKRNASGVSNAFISADMALAGIKSAIPADEVIEAMKKVGDAMPNSLKETAEGGLAATPTGKALYKKVFGRCGDEKL